MQASIASVKEQHLLGQKAWHVAEFEARNETLIQEVDGLPSALEAAHQQVPHDP